MSENQTPRRAFLKTLAVGAAAAAASSQTLGAGGQDPGSGGKFPYEPKPKPGPVVKPGEFVIAAAHLDHGHINGMCGGLAGAGATVKWVFEPDEKKRAAFQKQFSSAKTASSLEQILDDPEVKLVGSAAIPKFRGPIGCQVMRAGKDYFSDKPPFTTLEQLAQAKTVVAETGRKFMVYYGERIHNEAAMFATDLVEQGAIGRVLQVMCIAPHREGKGRPDWFYDHDSFGGILCDIGSHQFEQFIAYAGIKDAKIMHSAVANYAHPDHPGFEDFGETNLLGNNGSTSYVRLDWFTPPGLGTWGDGRTFLLGEKGFIELRKYIDLARSEGGGHVFLADQNGEYSTNVSGKIGFRYFGELILDCLNRTENAMTQAHAFKATELALLAQAAARKIA